MKKAKEFDCVEMKDRIQERMLRRQAGMTDQECREDIRRILATSDSPVAKMWRSMTTATPTDAPAKPVRRT